MKIWLSSGLWFVLLFALVLQLSGWIVFGFGFFPMKQNLSGISDLKEQELWLNNLDISKFTNQRYDRTVFMVIDAFRADFINKTDSEDNHKKAMSFVHSLMEESKILPFVGKAQAPTVTLPRIKALLSGSFPSFWDFVENFHSPALQLDSLMHQFRQYNWNSCFYGDDTWLRLFPPSENFFLRYEGTTSFFVAVS